MGTMFEMKQNYIATVLAILCLSQLLTVEARKWQDVVDRSIYLQPDLDMARYQIKIERDAFFAVRENDMTETEMPEAGAWITQQPAPTASPSAIPSDTPSLMPTGPTSSPTLRSENIDGNGGCEDGLILHRVNMYDSWGDGWTDTTMLTISGMYDEDTTTTTGSTVTKTHISQQGDTTVSITETVQLTADHPFGTAQSDGGSQYVYPLGQIFEGTLQRGSHGDAWVCLKPKRCYEVTVGGGDYLDEVSWSIQPVFGDNLVLAIEGSAPMHCSFSIPDESGQTFCEASCSNTLPPEETISPAIVDQLNAIDGNDGSIFELTTRSADLGKASAMGTTLIHSIENVKKGSSTEMPQQIIEEVQMEEEVEDSEPESEIEKASALGVKLISALQNGRV